MAKKQRKFTVACVQLNSKQSISKNLANTKKYINKACGKGADFILTPEVSNIVSLSKNHLLENTYLEDKDPFLSEIKLLAKKRSVWILLGSIIIKDKKNKLYNRSYLINSFGKVVSKYDKIHMFDVKLSNSENYSESKLFQAGTEIETVDLPWGRLGMSICYDMRFPAMYRKMSQSGAKFFSIPSAFTETTGKKHWHALLRARAIENFCYVFAPAQVGIHSKNRRTYGHSLIISPDGKILAEMKKGEGHISAKIDTRLSYNLREKIPSLNSD